MHRRDREEIMARWIIEYDLRAAELAQPPSFRSAVERAIGGGRHWSLHELTSDRHALLEDDAADEDHPLI